MIISLFPFLVHIAAVSLKGSFLDHWPSVIDLSKEANKINHFLFFMKIILNVNEQCNKNFKQIGENNLTT